MKDENQVFVSYGHVEEEMCKDICAYLSGNGFKPWVDTSKLQHGMLWRDEIRKGIEDSGQVVALLSAYSTRDRGVCLDEISIAVGVTGGNIHTILLQEENIINVPPTIGFEQWFDMSDWKKKKAEGDQAYNEWFKAKMDDVIRRLRDPEHVEKYGQITELRKKLNVQYAVGRQQKLLNEHYTGRKWLGEKIDAWLEDPNAPRRCLVTGAPGVGKSAFAVHYAHYNPKTAAALFFSADMPNYNDPCVVIQTLAYLLACRLSAYRKSLLWELNQEDRTTLAKLTEKELLDKLIIRPLSQAINGNHPAMCIILDGLEECGDPQKNTLAMTIARYADSLPWWLHILIVARDVPAVKNYTKNALRIELCGEDKDNLEDIRAYYREALEEKFGSDPAWPETLEQITVRSQGIFLYAKMLTSLLLDKGTLDVGGDYPEGLREVFTLWFDWFFPDGEDYARRWRLPIGCVLGSPEPIPAQTLRRVFDWSENELADFEARLSILLRKGKNVFGDETLVFDHDFVKEWLSSGAGENFYFSSPEDGRKKMANALYAVFEEDEKRQQEFLNRHIGGVGPEINTTFWETVQLPELIKDTERRKNIQASIWFQQVMITAANYCGEYGRKELGSEYFTRILELSREEFLNSKTYDSVENLVDILFNYGEYEKNHGAYQQAKKYLDESIALAMSSNEWMKKQRINLVVTYNALGDVYYGNGEFKLARTTWKKALKIIEKMPKSGAGELRVAATLYERLGNLQRKQTESKIIIRYNRKKAKKFYEKAIEIYKNLEQQIETAEGRAGFQIYRGQFINYRNLGELYEENGNITDAMQAYQNSLDAAQKAYENRYSVNGSPESCEDLRMAYEKLAIIKHAEGKFNDAIELYKECVKLEKWLMENVGTEKEQRDYFSTLLNLGTAYRVVKKTTDAQNVFEQCISMVGKVDVPLDALATLYVNLAIVRNKNGNFSEAIEACEKGIQLAKELLQQKNTKAEDILEILLHVKNRSSKMERVE